MTKLKNVLSVSADAKTTKGETLGFLTGILYLAPSDVSGFQVCPMATLAGCRDACLYTAGRGAMSNVQKARIGKTVRFFTGRASFMADLVYSIKRLQLDAESQGLTPLVRLNGTSDIKWENIPLEYKGVQYPNIMSVFPNVTFYDYTKIAARATKEGFPTNYDLTFSYSGVPGFEKYNEKAIKAGDRVAAVFDKAENIPDTFKGLPVISGDDSDVRHIDPKGHIIGLYAKGKAKKDYSGFVIRLSVEG